MTEPGAVTQLILDALRRKGWTQADLARATGLDNGTVSDVVTETRWPRVTTQAKIEQALDLPDGSLQRALSGVVAPAREDADGVMLDLPDEALEGLSEAERDEVVTAARLAALQRAREIRGR